MSEPEITRISSLLRHFTHPLRFVAQSHAKFPDLQGAPQQIERFFNGPQIALQFGV